MMNYTNNKVLPIVLLVVGFILLFFAYQSSQSLGDQVSETLTGRFTDVTTWYLILGAVSALAGGGMLVFGRHSRY